jgi:hypothetical protein
VVDKGLIRHKFWGNFGSLPGFGRVIILKLKTLLYEGTNSVKPWQMLQDVRTLLSKEVSILTTAMNCENTEMDECIYSTVARGHLYVVGLTIIRVVKTSD